MKLGIHAHPQFSYITRAVIEVAKVNDVDLKDLDVVIFFCPNFIPHFNESLEHFINCSNVFNCIKSYKVVRVDLEPVENRRFLPLPLQRDMASLLRSLDGFDDLVPSKKRRELLINSVLDTCYRNLISGIDTFKFYTQPFSTHSREVLVSRISYSIGLIELISKKIREEGISHFVLSHANYDFYVSALLAAEKESIQVYVVNGGFHHSYQVIKEADSDPSSEGVAIDLCEGEDYLIDQALHQSLVGVVDSQGVWDCKRTPNSSNTELIVRLIKDGLLFKNPTERSILIYIPIFSEVNHHHALRPRSCDNRFEWLLAVTKYATINNIDSIVIKRHPHESFYQEANLVNSLIKYCIQTVGYRGKFVDIISPIELERFLFLQAKSRVVTIPIAYSGSVVAEYATRGLSVIAGNYCLGTCNGPFGMLTDFGIDLETRIDLSFSNPPSLLISNSEAIAKITNVLRLFSAIGKYHSSDRLFRLASDRFYFFGRVGNQNPSQHYAFHMLNYNKMQLTTFKSSSSILSVWT